MKLIIAGTRTFDDYKLLSEEVDAFIEEHGLTEIVCGMAKGADLLGFQYALVHNYAVAKFPARWDDIDRPQSEIGYTNGKKFWRKAGFVRNQEMVDYADALIAFWDGSSRGTADVIRRAHKKGLIVKIVNYERNNISFP